MEYEIEIKSEITNTPEKVKAIVNYYTGVVVDEIEVEEKDGEVITGSLYCKKCNYNYPITESVPNLLPPELQDKQ